MSKTKRNILALLAAVVTVVGGVIAGTALAAGSVTATFTKTSSWNTGYEAKYTITNGTSTALSSWTVEFDLPAGQSVSSLWDGTYTASAQHIAVKGTWNASVPAGGTASFGFVVSTTNGSTASPTGCKINGGSCDGGSVPPTTTTTTTQPPTQPGGPGAPYLYMGWGNPPNPADIMQQTGVKWFTMAFILSGGGCNPAWDGQRPLQGSADATAIQQIKSAGGQVVPSFGGWSGNKLAPNCSTPDALADAIQKVIDAYGLSAVDMDIENTDELESEAVQDRILGALKILKQRNSGLKTIVTVGTSRTGPGYWANRLIDQSKALGANIDVFTLMPFDFGGSDMYTDTVNAVNGLRDKLKSTFGWSDGTAYAHSGISGMNGLSDQRETTSVDTWTRIRDWAKSQGLARLAFWSVNRDRGGCDGQVASNCSGISQPDWAFTKITAGF